MKNTNRKPYKVPKKATGGFVDFLSKNSGAIGSAAGTAGALIGAIDGADGRPSAGGSIASGVLAGAGAGAALGPIGAGVGAFAGAITGIIQAQQRKAQERKEKEAKQNAEELQHDAYSKAILSNYATDGIVGTNYYAYGGNVYKAEGDEVIQHAPNSIPATDANGSLDRLASDTSLIEGDSHDAASGGINMIGGERIYSDRLNSTSGKTFAEEAEKLGKKKGKFEEKTASRNSATKNTGERMAANIDAKLDNLFIEQEAMKAPRTAFAKMALGGLLGDDLLAGTDPTQGTNYLDWLMNQSNIVPGADLAAMQPLQPIGFQPDYGTLGKVQGLPVPATGSNIAPAEQQKPNAFAKFITGLQNGTGAVAPFLDNIVNAGLRTPQVPKPLLTNNIRLNKDLDINADLASIDNSARALNLNIDNNTANSAIGRNNKLSAFARVIDARNNLSQQKNNFRTQQSNLEAEINSQIESRNNDIQNDYLMRDALRTDDVNRRISSNFANLSQDLQGMARDRKLDKMDLERFRMGVERNPEVIASLLDRPDIASQFSLEQLQAWKNKVTGTNNRAKMDAIIERKKRGN